MCFHDQGYVHNTVLYIGIKSHKKSDGHPVVLDGQLYTEGIFQSIDVDIR